MALILVFVNDTTGTPPLANYKVEVLIGDGTRTGSATLWTGHVTGHPRAHGWQALFERFLHMLRQEKQRDERNPSSRE